MCEPMSNSDACIAWFRLLSAHRLVLSTGRKPLVARPAMLEPPWVVLPPAVVGFPHYTYMAGGRRSSGRCLRHGRGSLRNTLAQRRLHPGDWPTYPAGGSARPPSAPSTTRDGDEYGSKGQHRLRRGADADTEAHSGAKLRGRKSSVGGGGSEAGHGVRGGERTVRQETFSRRALVQAGWTAPVIVAVGLHETIYASPHTDRGHADQHGDRP